MAELLLAGGKMLSTHCPKCKSPLFEYEGKTMCPVCSGEVQTERKAEEGGEKPRAETSAGEVERILLKKLNQLASKLESESSPRAMSETLEPMKLILEVLNRIKAR